MGVGGGGGEGEGGDDKVKAEWKKNLSRKSWREISEEPLRMVSYRVSFKHSENSFVLFCQLADSRFTVRFVHFSTKPLQKLARSPYMPCMYKNNIEAKDTQEL